MNKNTRDQIVILILFFIERIVERSVEEEYKNYVFYAFIIIMIPLLFFKFKRLREEDKLNGTNTVIQPIISMVVVAVFLIIGFYLMNVYL